VQKKRENAEANEEGRDQNFHVKNVLLQITSTPPKKKKEKGIV
jgi:hypothetical protein